MKGVDLIHLEDKSIFEVFGLQIYSEKIGRFPFSVRRCVNTVRGYCWTYSKALVEHEEKRSMELLKIIATTGLLKSDILNYNMPYHGCFGMTLMKMEKDANAFKKTEGYKNDTNLWFA